MSTPARRPAPAHVVVGLLIAFCALLLLKWIAIVAFAAVGLAALVWWARRDPTAAQPAPPAPSPAPPAPSLPGEPAPIAPRRPADDDCTWCGLPGGHRDASGRLMRPRVAHAF